MKWTCIRLRTSFLSFLFLCSYTTAAQTPGVFRPTSNMTSQRLYGHTATLLLNGKVLIAGGLDEIHRTVNRSAELFDPDTGTFTPTGDMTVGRMLHSATLLPDGRVLIAGGADSSHYLTTSELYDPSTGIFTPSGNMNTAKGWGHTATLLNNGRVLIAGGGAVCLNGNDGCAIVASPEIYDPLTGTFALTGDYADRTGDQYFGTAGLVGAPTAVLPDGEVLIASEAPAELYNSAAGAFRFTGQMTRGAFEGRPPRNGIGGTGTLLTNGKVLLAGGELFELSSLADAEIYDPSTGKFTAIRSMNRARAMHTATLLRDGTVLIAGDNKPDCVFVNNIPRCDNSVGTAELYDPATNTFATLPEMTTPRWLHTATLLMDGRILITGGYNNFNSAGAELYIPSVLFPAQIVSNLRFDRTSVAAGSSYSVNVSGSNLILQTFLDIRFTSPGRNTPEVVLNWQRGIAAIHNVPAGTASGMWTINGVRAHETEGDHTGSFLPVSATISVSP
jgi:Galactose oxidase, central domain